MKPVFRSGWVVATVLALGVLGPARALAQVPARFYLKTLSDANAVPLILNSLSGNTNPFDPSHTVSAGANFDTILATSGYVRTFSLFDRAAMVAVLEPVGRISGAATVDGKSIDKSATGFGDPMIEFNVNLLGPPAQKNIPDLLRYEPGLSIDLVADLAIPIGEYDSDQPLNLGQNRWYGRVGAPIIWQIGAWVPGRRTTLEVLPVGWFFGTNDDYVGKTLKADPMLQLDAHLTRDFTEQFWASFDTTWYYGGQATVDGKAGEPLNNLGFGFTLAYAINDNLNLTAGYKSTINDSAPDELRMDGFMFTLVYGWHPMIQGMRRLESE